MKLSAKPPRVLRNLLTFSFVLCVASAFGQNTLRLQIWSEDTVPIKGASVKILMPKSILFTGLTDNAGRFAIELPPGNAVEVDVSHIGYFTLKQTISLNGGIVTATLVMRRNDGRLDSVNVVARKPALSITADRMTLNVDGNTALGNSVVDLLKKVPGINITSDQLTLENKPVTFLINGKQSRLSGKDLLQYLGVNSLTGVAEIELITTPPPSMDAGFAGNVINLKLKKPRSDGMNGSAFATLGARSKTFNQSVGFNLNYRKGVFNIYSSGGGYRDKQNALTTTQQVYTTRAVSRISDTSKSQNRPGGIYNTTGMDVQLTKRTIIGLLLNLNRSRNESNVNSRAGLLKGSSVDSTTSMQSQTSRAVWNNSVNLNLSTQLDTSGTSLTADAEYYTLNSSFAGDQRFNYFLPDGVVYKQEGLLSQRTKNRSRIYGAKADYHRPGRLATFDAGAKFSTSRTAYDLSQPVNTITPGNNNDRFEYRENVLALYASASGQLRNWSYRAGLRGEYTRWTTHSFTMDLQQEQRYITLFPTMAISRTFPKNSLLSFSYRKSIARPAFNQLNPFQYFTSPFYFYTGNPGLLPYNPHSVRAGFSHRNKLHFATTYSFTRNKIIEISDLLPGTNVIRSTRLNNGRFNSLYVGVTYINNITPWWSNNTTLNFNYNDNSFEAAKTMTRFRNQALSGYTTQTFTLPHTWTIELYSYVSSGTYFDINYSKPFGFVDFKVNKKLGKANFSFSINDIFYTNITRTIVDYGEINIRLRNVWDSRRFNLSCSYGFGSKDVKASRQRGATAASEEKSRAY